MLVDIIISVLLSFGYAYNTDLSDPWESGNDSGCLTDELHGGFTDLELTNLINRRKMIREFMNNNLGRVTVDIIYVPIVFHNLYKIVDGEPIHSYCDYTTGSYFEGNYITGNDSNICNQRMVRSIEILNKQYLPAGVQFELHPDYSEMLHDTISGYDGFFDNATGNNLPNANNIKAKYNNENVLNIYTTDCLGIGNSDNYITCREGLYGYSTYPQDLQSNEPGVFIIHADMPGSEDNPNISTLAHEIGHFFSLLHINGIWFNKEGNIARELVNGDDCDLNGDLICDTPGSPGAESGAWYIDDTIGECVYHGFGGNYNPNDSTLIIGGFNNISPTAVIYNYCDEWEFPDYYGLENCESYTNYDNVGDFFGTRGLQEDMGCFDDDTNDTMDHLSVQATECHIDNYLYLPIGHNFMGPVILTRPCAQIGHPDYDNTKDGFTPEQFENIRYSIEHDYTGCNIITACNYDSLSYMLRNNDSLCRYPCSVDNGCLASDGEYNTNHNLFNCDGICINDIDGDNICDELEVVGCQNQDACNYNELATDSDTCEYPTEYYDCYGSCINDINNDGICDENIADCYSITGIYPNPVNPLTTIHYGLCQETDVQISIYNIHGRLITTLINEYQIVPGYHTIKWDASNTSSGIYLVQMATEYSTTSNKIILIK